MVSPTSSPFSNSASPLHIDDLDLFHPDVQLESELKLLNARIDEVLQKLSKAIVQVVSVHGPNIVGHSPSDPFSLEVKTSEIPNAGLGLFTATAVPNGSVVTEYYGHLHTLRTARNSPDKRYQILLPPSPFLLPSSPLILDCSSMSDFSSLPARYINDPRSLSFLNCVFVPNQAALCVDVVAIRDLTPGEEIYVDYGEAYWTACEDEAQCRGDAATTKLAQARDEVNEDSSDEDNSIFSKNFCFFGDDS